MKKTWLRSFYLSLVVVLLAVSLLTSVQVTQAHSYPVPPGCYEASHSHGCQRCGFLWLWKRDVELLTWYCPGNGSGGDFNLYGACDTCQY
jgi:hypothetical protein